MMKIETEVNEPEFQVLCVWCGKKIRNDKREDSAGECLQCFYRILSEKLRKEPRTFAGDFVSER
jgi:DNA-directed RNA polymerase subunit RPC12/RpoP